MCYVSFEFASNKQFPQDQDNTAVLGIPLAVMLYTVSRRKSLRYSDIYHVYTSWFICISHQLHCCGLAVHCISFATQCPSLQAPNRVFNCYTESAAWLWTLMVASTGLYVVWSFGYYCCTPHLVFHTASAPSLHEPWWLLNRICRIAVDSHGCIFIVWCWVHCCRKPHSLPTVAARTTPSVIQNQ